MELLLVSFFGGILTVFSPCVFTLLPVIVGGSSTGGKWNKVITISGSLGLSVFIFTLILKYSTSLIGVDPIVWKLVSGGLVFFLGMSMIFSAKWGQITSKSGLSIGTQKLLVFGKSKSGLTSDILTGIALGPVFSSCSPTYAIILATILPVDIFRGTVYLIAYSVGLVLILFLIGMFGQSIVQRLKWAVNPHGYFRIILGSLFIVVGLSIITGLDKKFETYLTEKQVFDFSIDLEKRLLDTK